LTSVASSISFGWIALGIIATRKADADQAAMEYFVDGTLTRVIDLPFPGSKNSDWTTRFPSANMLIP
jgi:hypothetical protein